MKLLRDPLVHFLVIGALLFGAFKLAGADDQYASGEIVVSAGQIADLQAIFSRTWQRPPNEEELNSLIGDYIRDEVLYREAVAMGLDRDDAVIRRRLRQKMEFVADAMADVEPTDEELRTYVAEHPGLFRKEPRFSFSHIYFKPESSRPGGAELENLLRFINAGTTKADDIGDAFMPGFHFEDLPRSGVAQIFGEDFASWIDRSRSGRWEGPVTSAYGIHLVHVSKRVEAREPPLQEIREAARREWLYARRVVANDALYEKLRSRYVITIEAVPEQTLVGKKLAEAGL